MPPVKIDGCGDREPDGKNVESGLCDLERCLLKVIKVFVVTNPYPSHHVPDSDAGDHFNKGIHSKSEERHASVFEAEENGDRSFDYIVGYGDERQC